ncbi:MAG: hypothetical protein ACRENE_24845 [Polyangiaceae bacterium]
MNVIDNRGCPSNNPPYGWTAIDVCYKGTFTASADFGGAYQHQGTTCTVGNPLAGGACACPSGSSAIDLVVDGSCYVNDNVTFCYNPAAPRASFGGAYQMSDNTSYGTSGCVVTNPATSACSCPSGTTAVGIEAEYGPSTSGCSNANIASGHLYVCVVP